MMGITSGNLFRIGELAKVAGISERTIDYYTKLGLISLKTDVKTTGCTVLKP